MSNQDDIERLRSQVENLKLENAVLKNERALLIQDLQNAQDELNATVAELTQTVQALQLAGVVHGAALSLNAYVHNIAFCDHFLLHTCGLRHFLKNPCVVGPDGRRFQQLGDLLRAMAVEPYCDASIKQRVLRACSEKGVPQDVLIAYYHARLTRNEGAHPPVFSHSTVEQRLAADRLQHIHVPHHESALRQIIQAAAAEAAVGHQGLQVCVPSCMLSPKVCDVLSRAPYGMYRHAVARGAHVTLIKLKNMGLYTPLSGRRHRH